MGLNKDATLITMQNTLEELTNTLRAGLQEFHNGTRLTGHRFVTVTAGRLIHSGTGRLVGWSLRATGGPVDVTFRNGNTVDSTDVIGVQTVPAGETRTITIPGAGVTFVEGLHMEVTTAGGGVLTGGVWLGAVD